MNYLIDRLNEEFDSQIPLWVVNSIENIPRDWEEILFAEDCVDYLVDVFKKLDEFDDDPENNFSPRPNMIFDFARLTNVKNISIVIIGQDPYPNPKHAHGLAFSSKDKNIPASLQNIYKCLIHTQCINKKPKHADLTLWAKRGVLLLNASLTTMVGKSNAHAHIWKDYTFALIENLSGSLENITFLLWGGNAKRFKAVIDMDDELGHKIMQWRHPSPMAQNKCPDKERFIHCDHFKKLPHINWNPTPVSMRAYTDGSAYPNKSVPAAKNGYAVIFTKGFMKGLGLYGSCAQSKIHPLTNERMYSTSQRAEGMAILKTLEKCKTCVDKWDKLEIVTDSEFWMNMLSTFMPKWERTGRDFNKQKNPDITIPMWQTYKFLLSHGKEIHIKHMKSHGKDEKYKNAEEGTREWLDLKYNEMADDLANHARTELEYDEYVEDDDIIEYE